MEEQREESEFGGDCREPMEEVAGKRLRLSSETQTLDDDEVDVPEKESCLEDANTVGNSVSDSGDESSEKTISTGDVERTEVNKMECEGDVEVESFEIGDDEERLKLVEVETNDEAAKSEIKSQNDESAGDDETVSSSGGNEVTDNKVEDNGGACDGETLSVAQDKVDQDKEPAKNSEEENNAHEGEIANVNHKEENGEAMEIDYATEEEVEKDVKVGDVLDNASMVQNQDAEVDRNDSNVVKEMEIDQRKHNADMASDHTGTVDSANPNSPSEDAAATGEAEPLDHNLFDPSSDITNFIDFSGVSSWSGNIQDLKTETGNVSLKEGKKATDMAEEVATQNATVNAESHDNNLSLNAQGIENESSEARGDESSAAAATECPKEASDAVMGSDENQEEKETTDQQVAMREEDEITHEATNEEEDTEMEENPNNSDDGTDSEIKTNGVKRMADVLSDEDSAGEGRKTVSLAKVAFAQTPSFKIGASIARAASQMAGSPSVLKGSNFGDKNLSVESFVSQLHRAATDPDKENVVSELAADFFVDFRNSTASQLPPEKVTKKRGRPSNSKAGGTEAFEFEEMGDTYWTDRVIHNGGEEQTTPTEKGNYQVVPVELKPAQVKKTRRPYRRRQSQIILPLPSASDKPAGFDENAPAELIMKFSETDTIPPEKSLSKMFRHFGPIKESQTEVDSENNRARVVFRKGADAEVAYNSAKSFNIFGTKAVNYELSFTITEAFKVQPYVVSLAEEDAALSLPS